jgi:hypothetical protein
MNKKMLFIIAGVITAIASLIVGLVLADVNVVKALTSSTAFLIYGAIVVGGLFFIFNHFTKGWK